MLVAGRYNAGPKDGASVSSINALPVLELPASNLWKSTKNFPKFSATASSSLWKSYREVFGDLEADEGLVEEELEQKSNVPQEEKVREGITNDAREMSGASCQHSKLLLQIYVLNTRLWNQAVNAARKHGSTGHGILSESLGRFTLWKEFLSTDNNPADLFVGQNDLGITTLKLLCSIGRCLSKLINGLGPDKGLEMTIEEQEALEEAEILTRNESLGVDKGDNEDDDGDDDDDDDEYDDDDEDNDEQQQNSLDTSEGFPVLGSSDRILKGSALVADIIEALDTFSRCLMELGPAIQHIYAEATKDTDSLRGQGKQVFKLHGAAKPFVAKILAQFKDANTEVANRLGEAYWQRSERIRINLDRSFPVPEEDFVKLLKIDQESVFTWKLNPAESNLKSSILPSIPQTSSAQTGRSARFPPSPEEISEGKPFCCGICKQTVTDVQLRSQLKAHLLADLQPYICCNSACRDHLVMFSTRKEWLDHEFSKHRSSQSNTGSVDPAESCTKCPLCQKMISNSHEANKSHFGHHLEWIAVNSLPNDAGPDLFPPSVGNLLTPPLRQPQDDSRSGSPGSTSYGPFSSASYWEYRSPYFPGSAYPYTDGLRARDLYNATFNGNASQSLFSPLPHYSSGLSPNSQPQMSALTGASNDYSNTWIPPRGLFSPSFTGPGMSNIQNPQEQFALFGDSRSGIMAGFNSGHAANMQPAYGGMHNNGLERQSQNDRPFKCDQCVQSFNRNHDLKRHKRIHLTVKPFPCGHCDKSFSRKDALKRHMLVKRCGKAQGEDEPDPSSPKAESTAMSPGSPSSVTAQ